MLLAWAAPASAQGPKQSSWGVVGTVVPKWRIPPSLNTLATVHFSEDDASVGELDLRGNEFRIGVARGRTLAGDWGVSFVRRTFVDAELSASQSAGLRASSDLSGVWTVVADNVRADILRRDVELTGIEAHKFVAFATIARRVQIGLNVAGGLGTTKGLVRTDSFRSDTTCRFPAGVTPPLVDNVCGAPNATIMSRSTVPLDSSVDDSGRLIRQKQLPIGRVELTGAIVLGSQFKVRVGGGLNYPGTNSIAVTGIYLFSRN
jgi:hypothetical protein